MTFPVKVQGKCESIRSKRLNVPHSLHSAHQLDPLIQMNDSPELVIVQGGAKNLPFMDPLLILGSQIIRQCTRAERQRILGSAIAASTSASLRAARKRRSFNLGYRSKRASIRAAHFAVFHLEEERLAKRNNNRAKGGLYFMALSSRNFFHLKIKKNTAG